MGGLLLGFLLSVGVLVFSSREFLRVLSIFWRTVKISPLVIGSTVVAVGTSLPEMVVGFFSIFREDPELTLGNLLGSGVVNVFFVLAVGILLGNINIGIKKTQKSAVFLAGVIFLFLLLKPFVFPSLKLGIWFLLLIFLFLFLEVYWGLEGRENEDNHFVGKGKARWDKEVLARLGLCLGGVVGGGYLTVNFAEKIALVGGFSSTVVGMSLLSLTTTLPELLTTVFSVKEDQKKIAIGNILGSNIFNLLFAGFLLGVGVRRGVLVPKESLFFLGGANLILIFLVFVYAGKKVPRAWGLLLLGGLVFYFSWLF